MSNSDPIDALEKISGSKSSDKIQDITAYLDQAWADENSNVSASDKSENITPASDVTQSGSAPSLQDTQPHLLGPVETSSTTNLTDIRGMDSIVVVDKVTEEDIHMDSDGDGIADYLDATGKESQIEQAYDRDATAEENVRSFLSLMSMLSNLDLTRLNSSFVNGDSQSLAVQVAAGAAQMSLMHTARLQEFPQLARAKKKEVPDLINKFREQDKKLKVKNLQYLARLFGGNNPNKMLAMIDKMSLPEAQKQRLRDNINLLRNVLPRPGSENYSGKSQETPKQQPSITSRP